MENQKPYHDNVTLPEIIKDGWARGFAYDQTLNEAQLMGYDLKLSELEREWAKLDSEMYTWFDRFQYEADQLQTPEKGFVKNSSRLF